MHINPRVLFALSSIVPFLFNTGLQVSGINNAVVTAFCWVTAALILVLAAAEYMQKWNIARREAGLTGLDSLYFIAPCLVVAALAIGGAAYGLGVRSTPNVSGAIAPTYSPPAQSGRLLKDPTIEWDENGIIWLTGTYAKSGADLTSYVKSFRTNSFNSTIQEPQKVMTIGAGTPSKTKIETDNVPKFERDTRARIRIGSLVKAGNDWILEWGKPSSGERASATGSFGIILLVDKDRTEDIHSVAIVSRKVDQFNPSPFVIGPDVYLVQEKLIADVK